MYVALREEHRLREFDKRVPRRIFELNSRLEITAYE
jgi:hypothetical protein